MVEPAEPPGLPGSAEPPWISLHRFRVPATRLQALGGPWSSSPGWRLPELEQTGSPKHPCFLKSRFLAVSLRSPISRAARACCVATPAPAAGVSRQPPGACCIFVVDRNRGVNRARTSDVPGKLHQIGMRDEAVVYVHGKAVGRITAAALRDEKEIPGSIVRGSGLGGRRQRKAGTANGTRE